MTAAIALFALNGYGAAVYFGEEMEQAPTRIARTVMLALVATLVLEGVPIVAALVGDRDLIRLFTVDNPFGVLVRERGSLGLMQWVSVGVALAIVNAIIAWVLACARFFYSTARDGCWGRPIDGWLTQIHPRFGSPWIGTAIVGAVAVALCFLPRRLLELWSATGLIAIYAGIAVAAMVGRGKGITAQAPYRMPLYPAAPLITFAALGYVTLTSWWDADYGRPALIATLVQVAVSAAYYLLVLRPRGNWDGPFAGGVRRECPTRRRSATRAP